MTVQRIADRLTLRYRLEGKLTELRIPPEKPKSFRDGLWQHTCFEVFVAAESHTSYLEFNFSPSGAWAAYDFSDYRQRQESMPMAEPEIAQQRGDRCLELSAVIDLSGHPASLRLGLSAVIESTVGALTYWALTHPGDRPDFHHRDSFALALSD